MIPIADCSHCQLYDKCRMSYVFAKCDYREEIRELFDRTAELFNIEKGSLTLCEVGQWVYAVKKMLVERND